MRQCVDRTIEQYEVLIHYFTNVVFEDPIHANDMILKGLKSKFTLAYLEFMSFNLGRLTSFNILYQSEISLLHELESELKDRGSSQAGKYEPAEEMLSLHRKMLSNATESTAEELRKNFLKSLVRPILEYASSAWSPHLQKHKDNIENVQRRATKILSGLKEFNYSGRLKLLNLQTLTFRRMRGDLIEMLKVLAGIYDERVTNGLFHLSDSTTRGHSLKVYKHHCRTDITKHFLTQGQ
eukprot:gene14953-16494_t